MRVDIKMEDSSSGSECSGFSEDELERSVRNFENIRNQFENSDIDSDWAVSDDSDDSSADENSESSSTDRSDSDSDDDGGEIGRIWSDRLRHINIRPFQEPAGPQHDLPPGSHPLDFFHLIFEEAFFTQISDQTNLYATQCQVGRQDTRWTPTTPEEIKAFISIQIIMGIHQLPEYSLYWADDRNLNVPGVSEVMTKARYEKLSQYLHLVDNTQALPHDHQHFDPLFKVRPVVEMVNANSLTSYVPGREMSIDEAMIGFKGRSLLKQYLPGKPTKWGIKVWQLSESSTGYTPQFQVYTGRREANIPGNHRGLGHRVVTDLSSPYFDKNYHLYFDNFFTSLPLAEELLQHQTYSCGTLRLNRRGLPNSVKNVKLRRQGDTKKRQKGNMLITIWKDKRQVAMLSTNQQPTDTLHRPRRGAPVLKPDAISNYNQHMGGVDLADQHRAYYSIGRESKKWWKYVLHYCLDIAMINAHRIYLSTNQPLPKSSRRYSHLNFRLQVADGLRAGFTSRKRVSGSKANVRAARPVLAEVNLGHHQLVHIEGRKKTCVQCSAHKIRTPKGRPVETSFKCGVCNIPLCRTNGCFIRYHQEHQR